MAQKKYQNKIHKFFHGLRLTSRASRNRGVALYLSIVVLAVMTTALLALIVLALSQIRIIWTIGDSVTTFYAADSGMERVLYKIYKQNWTATSSWLGRCIYPVACELQLCPAPQWQSMPGVPAEYQVCVSNTSTTTIWSTGNYTRTGTKRKIETRFE